MPTYFFQLGNTPELSLLELESLTAIKPQLISSQLAFLKTKQELDLKTIQAQSGGLVKSFLQIATFQTTSVEEIETKIANYLATQAKKITFSIFFQTQKNLPKINLTTIKNLLQAQGIKARYIESNQSGLSAAVLLHQKVLELVIMSNNSELVLAQTASVQDIDDWTKRDRSKPYFDRKKGMLPPKVARIMVNIARGLKQKHSQNLSATTDLTLYDPFCGSGTILMEALLQNFTVQGADLDLTATKGTQENLHWLATEYQLKPKFLITQRDATQKFSNSTTPFVDLLVTEPFLGKLTPKDRELPNMFQGLYRTYLGAFKNWSKILHSQAILVVILPLVETKNKTYHLNKLIDKLPELGYTILSQPIIYSRPQAIVKRQIIFLSFKG